MINFKRTAASAIATGAILLYSLVPATYAATTIEVSGNGSSSTNNAEVTNSQTTTVVQSNDAKIENNVKTEAKTGGNEANDNTGGTVSINTGSANSTTNVTNAANVNQANVQNCGTCNTNQTVTISGNGSDSTNHATLDNTNDVSVYQQNKANIENKVETEAKTGYNEANRNTGGDVSIHTGSATAQTTVTNTANANQATIGHSGAGTGTISALISGNGSSSDNNIDLENNRSVTLVQSNEAKIENEIETEAKTGGNEANDNTHGNVTINTGNANAGVTVDNTANFNVASIDCCLLDVMAKVAGNGSDSNNRISLTLDNALEAFQNNCGHENMTALFDSRSGDYGDRGCSIENDLEANAKTGYNEANRGTDPVAGDDASIITGSATDTTTIHNTGNTNAFGPSATLQLPSGLAFDFHFSLSDLLGFLNV